VKAEKAVAESAATDQDHLHPALAAAVGDLTTKAADVENEFSALLK